MTPTKPLPRRLALLGSLALAACSDTRSTTTGFLSSPDVVRAAEDNPEGDRIFRRATPAGRWVGFRIEEVVWRPAPSAPTHLPEADIAAALAEYRAALEAAFGARLPPAPAAGDDVLRIRAALTDLRRAQPVLNVLVMAVVKIPPTSGGASSESEVLDGRDGSVVAALAAYHNGGRSFLGGPFGFLSQCGHARRALRLQAEHLRDLALGAAT